MAILRARLCIAGYLAHYPGLPDTKRHAHQAKFLCTDGNFALCLTLFMM